MLNSYKRLQNSKEWTLLCLFAPIVLAIKIFVSQILMLDSDEIMWSVMAHEMIRGDRFYLFFTTQNFTGAQESYAMFIPQLLTGFNIFTLRFGPAFWTTCSTFLIYLTFRRKFHQGVLIAIAASFLYNLWLAQNFIIHTKSWGNYPFTECMMLLAMYIFLSILNSAKTSTMWSVLLGLIFGINFIQHMQSLYFAIFIILVVLAFWLWQNFAKFKKFEFKKHDYFFLVYLLISFVNFYFIAKKRMIFNPLITLNEKFGLLKSQSYLIDSYAIKIEYLILIMWIIAILYLIYSYRKFPFENLRLEKLYITLVSFLFMGIYVCVRYNSFSRVSTKGEGFSYRLNFFYEIIIRGFLGNYWYLYLGIACVGIFYSLYKSISAQHLNNIVFYNLLFVFFPLVFLASDVPKLTDVPRYLIIWWPVICINVLVAATFLNNKYKNVLLIIIMSPLLLNLMQEKNLYIMMQSQAYDQYVRTQSYINAINESGIRYCDGDYWKVGAIMFYSKMQIICWNNPRFGWKVDYLDHYKLKYGNEVIYHIE